MLKKSKHENFLPCFTLGFLKQLLFSTTQICSMKNTIKKTDSRLNIFSKITEYKHFYIRCHGSSIASWEFQLEQIKILKVYSYWNITFAYDILRKNGKCSGEGKRERTKKCSPIKKVCEFMYVSVD